VYPTTELVGFDGGSLLIGRNLIPNNDTKIDPTINKYKRPRTPEGKQRKPCLPCYLVAEEPGDDVDRCLARASRTAFNNEAADTSPVARFPFGVPFVTTEGLAGLPGAERASEEFDRDRFSSGLPIGRVILIVNSLPYLEGRCFAHLRISFDAMRFRGESANSV
jgi:hypothetical protein